MRTPALRPSVIADASLRCWCSRSRPNWAGTPERFYACQRTAVESAERALRLRHDRRVRSTEGVASDAARCSSPDPLLRNPDANAVSSPDVRPLRRERGSLKEGEKEENSHRALSGLNEHLLAPQ
jgi:hypothetical protein